MAACTVSGRTWHASPSPHTHTHRYTETYTERFNFDMAPGSALGSWLCSTHRLGNYFWRLPQFELIPSSASHCIYFVYIFTALYIYCIYAHILCRNVVHKLLRSSYFPHAPMPLCHHAPCPVPSRRNVFSVDGQNLWISGSRRSFAAV